MENSKTIGLLTTFSSFDPAFSLTTVVRDQLVSLVKYGYKTVLCVLPNFKDEALVPKGVEIRKIVPQIILEPYRGLAFPDRWKDDVQKVKGSFERNPQGITHPICHGIFFLDTYLVYNIALRDSHLNCKIFSWTHSRPSARPVLQDNPH